MEIDIMEIINLLIGAIIAFVGVFVGKKMDEKQRVKNTKNAIASKVRNCKCFFNDSLYREASEAFSECIDLCFAAGLIKTGSVKTLKCEKSAEKIQDALKRCTITKDYNADIPGLLDEFLEEYLV